MALLPAPAIPDSRTGAWGQGISTRATDRVTAVVVTYNGREYVGPCLHSLRSAADRPLRILVVDNASADDTVDLLRRSFPHAEVLPQYENLGYGVANNVAARLIDSEYIAIVNQDVVSRSGWIDRLVDALDANPTAAMATPMILLKDDPGRVNTCGNEPHFTGLTVCRGYNLPAWQFTQQEEVGAVSGAAFVIRRSVFETLGGFDSLYFLYLEDTDLSLRAILAGHRCLFVPEAEVMHAFEPQFSAEKLAWLERHRHAMLLKLFHWRTLVMLAPALVLSEVLVVGYAALRGPRALRAKLSAYVWVGFHLAEILERRRRVQMLRRVGDGHLLARMAASLDASELGHPLAKRAVGLANWLFRPWYRLVRRSIRW